MTLTGTHTPTAFRLTPLVFSSFMISDGMRAIFKINLFWGVNVLLRCHFCIMATDQRRLCLHLIALKILNVVLNDTSNGDQTLVQQ